MENAHGADTKPSGTSGDGDGVAGVPKVTVEEVTEEGTVEKVSVAAEEDVDDTSPAQGEPDPEVARAEAAAAKERAAQRQLLAIEELIYTERNYLRSLQLCSVTIRSNLRKMQPPLANLDDMFLHMEEVIEVSGRLLSLLDQKQMKPDDPLFLETLCDSFLSLSTDVEAAYKEYLTNYSQITAVENSYKLKEAQWNEIIRVIKASAPEVKATSLSFFLVMPVQRIARYPLLLQTIQKHTEPQHPAFLHLERTARVAVELNVRINEYKRFREVADKYRKTETLTIKDKINRLNGHSIAKKTARLSQLIKHETGMVPKLKDEEFDALEGFFYVLEKGILDLHDNVETYMNHLQSFISCKPEEYDLDLENETALLCYTEIMAALRQWILPSFELRLRALVYKPLCVLKDLLAGPRNLIRKRLHKLLDYELIEEKANLSYDEQAVADTYRTLNTLLLNELPPFNGLALQLLWGMLGAFSCLQRDLAADVEQLAAGFTQQLPQSSLENAVFWEWVEASVLEGAKRLEGLCRNVEEDLNAPIVQALSPTSQKRLNFLTEKHGSGKVYMLSSHVVGSRDLDLTLSKGELVALVSEMDTRGDRRRWLVDAGGPRGYVPSSKLIRYHQVSTEPPPSPHLTTTFDAAAGRRHSYTPGFSPPMPTALPCFQVFAGYNFVARSSHEVSLRTGDRVRVLEPHDKKGNPDWSLVEAGGRRGYVPSNYLMMRPAPLPPARVLPTAPIQSPPARQRTSFDWTTGW